MGGAVHDSNISPAAEFNIFVDSEAAKIVFGCDAPIVMVGLDVTNKAQLSFADIDDMEFWKGRASWRRFCASLQERTRKCSVLQARQSTTPLQSPIWFGPM
jgi:inosine-uridine nucleoside N-ribohydrolase